MFVCVCVKYYPTCDNRVDLLAAEMADGNRGGGKSKSGGSGVIKLSSDEELIGQSGTVSSTDNLNCTMELQFDSSSK